MDDSEAETDRNNSCASTLEAPSSPETELVAQGKRKATRKKTGKRARIEVAPDSNRDLAIKRLYEKYKKAPQYDSNSEEVFCICRKPDTGELMIACDECDEWFHFSCMKYPKDHQKLIFKFYCLFCEWRALGTTLWKKQCRLPGCLQPIRQVSKYCSEEHGILFMKKYVLDRAFREDNLSVSEVSTVAGLADVAVIARLGAVFPRIAFSEDYAELPAETRTKIQEISTALAAATHATAEVRAKAAYVARLKERVRLWNDTLTERINADTGKKAKRIKVDVCGFNSHLRLPPTSWAEFTRSAEYSQPSDADADADALYVAYSNRDATRAYHSVCITDRRKCIKHNGWLAIANDEASTALHNLERVKRQLVDRREVILKDYTIQVYEGSQKSTE